MKKQTKSNWQKQIVFAAIATIVFMFTASSVAVAQGKYKVGDRVECDYNLTGKFKKGTVVPYAADDFNQAGINGRYYRVLIDGSPIAEGFACQATSMRSIAGAAASNAQNNSGTPAQNQAANPNTNQTTTQGTQTTKTNKFGTRDARTCANTKAPARGAITAALAKQYFICQAEKRSGENLYLVENVSLAVGGGRAFQPQSDVNYSDINVKVPIYPIRGSYTKYQCEAAVSGYNIGQNCQSYDERKATGSCYKTTFGDWRCSMFDSNRTNDDIHRNVAPPK